MKVIKHADMTLEFPDVLIDQYVGDRSVSKRPLIVRVSGGKASFSGSDFRDAAWYDEQASVYKAVADTLKSL